MLQFLGLGGPKQEPELNVAPTDYGTSKKSTAGTPLSEHKGNTTTPLSHQRKALSRTPLARMRALSHGTPNSQPSAKSDVAKELSPVKGAVSGRAAVEAAQAANREILPVGTKLWLYWEGSDEWYTTTVLGHTAQSDSHVGHQLNDGATFKHRCAYDEASVVEHDLGLMEYEVVEMGDSSSLCHPAVGIGRKWLELAEANADSTREDSMREASDYAYNYSAAEEASRLSAAAHTTLNEALQTLAEEAPPEEEAADEHGQENRKPHAHNASASQPAQASGGLKVESKPLKGMRRVLSFGRRGSSRAK